MCQCSLLSVGGGGGEDVSEWPGHSQEEEETGPRCLQGLFAEFGVRNSLAS